MSIQFSKILWLISLFCCWGGICLTSSPVKGETVLEEINRTGILKVGVRNDAIPFGYRHNGQLQGLCLNLVQLIREEIVKTGVLGSTHFGDRTLLSVNLIVSGLYNRFDIVQDGVVHLECGPNSIRNLPNYDNVTFSRPFFITGIQFVTKNNQPNSIVNSEGKDLTLGVLAYTNTEILVREKYPNAQFQLFQGSRGNLRGIQSVNQGRIDAFANDGILLLGEAILEGIAIGKDSDLTIVPEIPLTCERYGLILPQDENWVNFINSVLNSDAFRHLRRDWFISLAEESLLPREQCFE